MTPLQISMEQTAQSVIKNLKKRDMEGYYCATKEDAVARVLSLVEEGASCTWGGSVTFTESGVYDALKAGGYRLLDRAEAKTPEEQRAFYGQAVMADYFFMSTNAITLDGQMVNIDGNGNRVACLIAGPQNVIVLAGMNKLVPDVEAGIARVHTYAAPPNGVRLNLSTPCAKTGVCADCLSPDCMCAQVVITRKSRKPGRIKVILIGESLGY